MIIATIAHGEITVHFVYEMIAIISKAETFPTYGMYF